MANIVILKGSPRERGNSSTLAEQTRAGAEAAGASVEAFHLHRMDIRPCDACDFCRGTGICAIADDMQGLYPKLLGADALVLASPIYWGTYSAQLKTCIDRWYALTSGNADVFKGRPVGAVLTFADPDVYASGVVNAIHAFESMFRYVEADFVGCVYGCLSRIGDAQKNSALMEQARQLGERLARR